MPATRLFCPGAALVALQRGALFDRSVWNEGSDPCLDAWRQRHVTCASKAEGGSSAKTTPRRTQALRSLTVD